MDTPSGPGGRRARWHELLSKFDLTVEYIPGPHNVVADALSRFAYPASKTFQDTSFHGNEEARLEMKEIIENELHESKTIGLICFDPTKKVGNKIYVAGTMSRKKFSNLDPHYIFQGDLYAICHGSNLNANAQPFIPLSYSPPTLRVLEENPISISVVQSRATKKRRVRFENEPESNNYINDSNQASSSSQSHFPLIPPTPTPPTVPPLVYNKTTLQPPHLYTSWDEDYSKSAHFALEWNQVHMGNENWPK